MKIITLALSLVLFMMLSSVHSQETAQKIENTGSVRLIKQDEATQGALSQTYIKEIYKQIFEVPFNLGIFIWGIITLSFNFCCWWIAAKRKNAIDRHCEEYVADRPNIITEASLECFAGLQTNHFMRRFTKLSGLIESIFAGTLAQGRKDDLLKNIYFAFVDVLPLAGISGTLYAISRQALSTTGLNATVLKSNLGLAIFSTLLALGFTIFNKLLESGWLHHFEYVEKFREFFSVYQMSKEGVAKDSLDVEMANGVVDK